MTTPFRAASLLLLALAIAGCAGERAHRKADAPWHPASAMLTKYDANHDGSVTRAEMDAGLRADFIAADAKHTGCLDGDETSAINQERYAEDKSTYSPLVDFKGKGCIDYDEFTATPMSLFDTLDRDNKGILTPKELNPFAAEKKPGDSDASGHHHSHHGGGFAPSDRDGSGGN